MVFSFINFNDNGVTLGTSNLMAGDEAIFLFSQGLRADGGIIYLRGMPARRPINICVRNSKQKETANDIRRNRSVPWA
jgi:hypothetical protein